MQNTKKWYQSKRIQGAIVGFLGLVGIVSGVDFDQGMATENVSNIMAGLGWLWNFYGSIVAKHKIQ